MSGVKGKSGRKPDPLAGHLRNKKISFYIKEHKNGKEWIEDKYFVFFKRKHGSSWQKMLRRYMKSDATAFVSKHWPCSCSPLHWKNKKHWRQEKCHTCGEYRDEYSRRMYEGPIQHEGPR